MSVTNDDTATVDQSVDAPEVEVVSDDVVAEKRDRLQETRELVAKLERENAEREQAASNAEVASRIDNEQAALDAQVAALQRAAGIEVEPPKEAFGAPLTLQEQAERDGKYFDPETGNVYDEKPSDSEKSEVVSDPNTGGQVSDTGSAGQVSDDTGGQAGVAASTTDTTSTSSDTPPVSSPGFFGSNG